MKNEVQMIVFEKWNAPGVVGKDKGPNKKYIINFFFFVLSAIRFGFVCFVKFNDAV